MYQRFGDDHEAVFKKDSSSTDCFLQSGSRAYPYGNAVESSGLIQNT